MQISGFNCSLMNGCFVSEMCFCAVRFDRARDVRRFNKLSFSRFARCVYDVRTHLFLSCFDQFSSATRNEEWTNAFIAFGQRKSGEDGVDDGHCFGRWIVFIAAVFLVMFHFGCELLGLNHLIDKANGGSSINKQTNEHTQTVLTVAVEKDALHINCHRNQPTPDYG